jgi:hypothetical protein
MEAFFSQVAYKSTGEWKEEIVLLSPTAMAPPIGATFPDGTKPRIKAGTDPRAAFAQWLIQKNNPWFARAFVNRTWAWLFGRGLIHEADDIREDNPPVLPQVLEWLEQEFIRVRYDVRHLLRVILNSGLYQQSPLHPHTQAPLFFTHYPVRRLDAEVLIDALCKVTGTTESYSSAIPEPFTFVPEDQRTVELADGSTSSAFLELFGRPSRDTGLMSERSLDPTLGQRLHLLNSTHIQRKIEKSPVLAQWMGTYRGDRPQMIKSLYLRFLSRPATDDEIRTALHYIKNQGLKPRQALNDLAWALINSKEFLYRH